MKYIRTKDGRISYLSSEPNEEITDYEIITSKGTLTYRREDEVIKVANTIEELCDMCIVWFKDDKYPMFDDVSGINRYKELKQFGGNIRTNVKYDAIYLAIWTDKELIYVAKMNKKGELELL